MYKIHSEFGSAWYVTFGTYHLNHVTDDIAKIQSFLNRMTIAKANNGEDLHEIQRMNELVMEIHRALAHPLIDVENAKRRSTV